VEYGGAGNVADRGRREHPDEGVEASEGMSGRPGDGEKREEGLKEGDAAK
jgi:hypothetical protein